MVGVLAEVGGEAGEDAGAEAELDEAELRRLRHVRLGPRLRGEDAEQEPLLESTPHPL